MTVPATALVVIDMLNPYDHEDADELAASVETIVAPLRGLIARACAQEVEVVYVNDQYEDFPPPATTSCATRWQAAGRTSSSRCCRPRAARSSARPLVQGPGAEALERGESRLGIEAMARVAGAARDRRGREEGVEHRFR